MGKSPPSDGTGDIGEEDLSTQSIIGAVFLCPIPTRNPTRDDDGGERHSRHFDRSGAEWGNLLPLMVRATLGQEISRLRVSSERLPSAPYRHAAPLEMTVAASTIRHAFGVRVDGATPRGLWPPDGGRLCSLALRGATAALPLRVVVAPFGRRF